MTSETILNVRTASDLAQLIPPHWVREVRRERIQSEFFSKYEGKEGSGAMIITKNDFKTQPGNTLTFTVESELYGAGIAGESELSGNEEKPSTAQFPVPIAILRHAEALTYQANESAMVDEIVKATGRLGRWFGKRRDEDVFAEILGTSGGGTILQLFGGTATSDATLTSSSVLTPGEIENAVLALSGQAMPLEMRDTKTGEVIQTYACIIDAISRHNFFQNSSWRTAVQNALPRGFDHPLMIGAVGRWAGCLIRCYERINQNCRQGTPQRPECKVLVATSGQGSFTVGANDGKQYTKHFPASGTLEIREDATYSAETIAYTSKTAYSFTVVGTLASTHSAGAIVTYQNHRSQLIYHGAEVLVRAFKEMDKPITNVQDYGMNQGVGLLCWYGQRLVEDTTGNPPNVLLQDVWAKSPNWRV